MALMFSFSLVVIEAVEDETVVGLIFVVPDALITYIVTVTSTLAIVIDIVILMLTLLIFSHKRVSRLWKS